MTTGDYVTVISGEFTGRIGRVVSGPNETRLLRVKLLGDGRFIFLLNTEVRPEPACVECGHPESEHESDEDRSYCMGEDRQGNACRCWKFKLPAAAPTVPSGAGSLSSTFEAKQELTPGMRLPPPFARLVIGEFLRRTDTGGWLYAVNLCDLENV